MQSRDFFWLGAGLAAGFALGAAFPRLRKEFGPIVKEASERAGELATELTAVIMEQIRKGQEQQAEPSAEPQSPERAAS